MFIKQIQDQLLESCPPQTDVLSGRQVLIGPYQEKPALSLPAFLRLVGLLLLPLPLSSHLLQLLPVFPLDEALLMGHLWEVIWSSERQGGKPRGVDQGEQTERDRGDKVSFQPGHHLHHRVTTLCSQRLGGPCLASER